MHRLSVPPLTVVHMQEEEEVRLSEEVDDEDEDDEPAEVHWVTHQLSTASVAQLPLQSLLVVPMEQWQVSCALSSGEPVSQEAWYPAAQVRPNMLRLIRATQSAAVAQLEEEHGVEPVVMETVPPVGHAQ